jgi:hypothetical protein
VQPGHLGRRRGSDARQCTRSGPRAVRRNPSGDLATSPGSAPAWRLVRARPESSSLRPSRLSREILDTDRKTLREKLRTAIPSNWFAAGRGVSIRWGESPQSPSSLPPSLVR